MTLRGWFTISTVAVWMVGGGVAWAQSAGNRAAAALLTPLSEAKTLTAVGASTTSGTTAGGNFLSPSMVPGVGGANGANASGGNRALSAIGSRTTTQSQRPSATGAPTEGGEFLLQRSHDRGTFVGHDSADGMGFVGNRQALVSAPIRSSISTLRIRTGGATLNPSRPSRANSAAYDARLVVGFDYAPRPAQSINSALTQQLASSPSIQWTGPCAVSMEAGTATLRGTVASERDRALAEQWLLFEPGIDSVKNLLTLKPPAPPKQP